MCAESGNWLQLLFTRTPNSHRGCGSSVGKDDGVIDGSGARADGGAERERVVPSNGSDFSPKRAGGAAGIDGRRSVRPDAQIEVIVALVVGAVRGTVPPMGRNVVTAVAVVAVVGPRVAVVVTNELHLPLAGTLCRSLHEEKCGSYFSAHARKRGFHKLTGM